MMAGSLSSDMNVLEVATGTGLIAVNIASFVRYVVATDFSLKMIDAARMGGRCVSMYLPPNKNGGS